jgi:flagellar secretion chaperone FliS
MDARSSYREAAVRGASPVRLVICLYEQAIEDLRRAVIALEKGDIEARTRGINHALMVIAQLQGSLDMERGGGVSINLERFYNVVRSSLIEAQLKQSVRILEQQISQLVMIHEAWLEVELVTATPRPLVGDSPVLKPGTSSPETSFADWNA